jgi:hypothetical protein
VLIDLRLIRKDGSDEWTTDLEDVASVSTVRSGWRCPITRRFLDAAIRGLSPYHADAPRGDASAQRCEVIKMPALPYSFGSDARGNRKPVLDGHGAIQPFATRELGASGRSSRIELQRTVLQPTSCAASIRRNCSAPV